MPYITPEKRELIAKLGGLAATGLSQQLPAPLSPGDLNFIISRLIWAEFERNRSYTKGNELVGVLECVKQEFIRRKLNPYEDEKIKENGDLP